jgi:5-methylcytosine-specific restriction endonuclease McrA
MQRPTVPPTWADHEGKTWKTPQILGRLRFRIPCHAALRAFVFKRDGYACLRCGDRATVVPDGYTGREALGSKNHCLVLDHIVSRRNGGSHHPSNLQTLCDSCNAAKVTSEDRRRTC